MTIRYLIAVLFAAVLLGHASAQGTPALKIEPVKKETKKAVIKKTVPKVTSHVTKKQVTPKRVQPVQPAIPAGSHEDWMNQAGIPKSDWAAVDYIVTHESSWDYNATEPTTGAHGLPQALPYTKTGCGWSDPICQLRWANAYAVQRYGGWWAAYTYWTVHRNW